MFKRKNTKVTIDGTTLVLVELSFGDVKAVGKLTDENEKVAHSLYLGCYKEDRTRYFADPEAVCEVPLSILAQLTEVLGELNRVDPKK